MVAGLRKTQPLNRALTINMNEYRVTKYNPDNRNELGHYLDLSEWTEFSDVGKSVTLDEYEVIESAYINSALDLITNSKTVGLTIESLEDYQGSCEYKDEELVPFSKLPGVVRSLLRGEYWCKLVAKEGFIHIGYDYYMYVGSSISDADTISRVINRGLYVENFISPYHPEDC